MGKITHYIGLEDSRYVKFINSGIQEFINYLKEQGVLKGSKNLLKAKFKNPSSLLELIADRNKNIKLIVFGSSSLDIKQI